jgi:hypothetical protein
VLDLKPRTVREQELHIATRDRVPEAGEKREVEHDPLTHEIEENGGDHDLAVRRRPEHDEGERDERVDSEDVSVPDETPVNHSDPQKHSRASVVRGADVDASGCRALQLNSESDPEKQNQQAIETAVDQVVLRP